jgi:hypothetical protein
MACAEGSDDAVGGGEPTGNGGAASSSTTDGSGGAFTTASSMGGGDPGISEVFGHSKSTLYKLNPDTKAVGIVGNFSGCQDVEDIALDEDSNLFGTTSMGLFRIDRGTAACTLVASGDYPNSLSFVPAGTLDPDVEALVGYVDDQYVRIDPMTGAIENIGAPWNNNFVSSGDIVSVKDGPTYLTIKDAVSGGGTCNDCLVSINPATGAIMTTYPNLGYDRVFGAAFWAGSVYGFTTQGELFEVTIVDGQLMTTPIETPQGLSFWGAGSTTSAPPVPQ